jgi:hypothetical protein
MTGRGGRGRPEASLGRSSEAREGIGASPFHREPARGGGESEASGRGGRGPARSLKTEEHSHAREARSGRRIHHPQIIGIPVDTLEESLPPCVISHQERGGELLAFADQYGDGKREARIDCVKSARGSPWPVCSERGGDVEA